MKMDFTQLAIITVPVGVALIILAGSSRVNPTGSPPMIYYPDAHGIHNVLEGGKSGFPWRSLNVSYSTSASPTQINSFYNEALIKDGWKYTGCHYTRRYNDVWFTGWVHAEVEESGETSVTIKYGYVLLSCMLAP